MFHWTYRDSGGATTDLIPLFQHTLQLCNLREGEQVMVYGDHHTPMHYAKAAMAAAQDAGAQVFQLEVPTEGGDILSGPVWDIWHAVDLVVDLESIGTSIYRPLRVSALEAGVRVLRVTQPEDVLFRLKPLPVLRDRVRRCEALLAAARELRATSPAGTDLVLNTADRKAFGLWGAADQPGKWDHWSVAVVVGGASRPRSNGRLVIDVGDIILGMRRYATTRIDLIIEEGIITRIEGEGLDAHLLRNWFASWGDERAYHISHVGWGCDERADWGRMAGPTGGIGDAESYPGVFQIAFGRDTSWYIGDGTNDVVAHIDFNGLAHSITLDGVPITENGRFVHPDLTHITID